MLLGGKVQVENCFFKRFCKPKSTCGANGGFLAGELLLLAATAAAMGVKVEKGILGELDELEEA